jgi:hypothetical protein
MALYIYCNVEEVEFWTIVLLSTKTLAGPSQEICLYLNALICSVATHSATHSEPKVDDSIVFELWST